ncbi:hypothetical protein LEP1GSC187_0594 [Leptospira santarosai str. ZUN179]|uniref:Uncharacterized protein n=1 Tax=Leptospira santarosai str. ZUN179 TaxID=1049985 RepID=M6UT45_9LEPT|nr:hypothetical protein LEP1GSC187_0594 [Leptospira santarosai str. ZUN179]
MGLRVILCITLFSFNLLTGAESPVSEKRNRINHVEYSKILKYETIFSESRPIY